MFNPGNDFIGKSSHENNYVNHCLQLLLMLTHLCVYCIICLLSRLSAVNYHFSALRKVKEAVIKMQ